MPADPRDSHLDLSSTTAAESNASPAAASRPFLSIHFACCGVYQRIYRSADGKQYVGRCPRCAKPVRFVVGTGGTAKRSFTAW